MPIIRPRRLQSRAGQGRRQPIAAPHPKSIGTNETKERVIPQAPIAGYRPGECFVGAARKASRRLTQFYDEALASCGLRSTQYSILSELTRFASPPTLAELASALVSDRSAVGHNLRPLIRDGYLALEPGAEDRRERRIILTPQGQLKDHEARALWQAAQDEFLAVYGEHHSESLRAALLGIAYDPRLGRTEPRAAP